MATTQKKPTLGSIYNHSPKHLRKFLDKHIIPSYGPKALWVESFEPGRGDIYELDKILKHDFLNRNRDSMDMTHSQWFIQLYKVAMNSYGLIGYEEFQALSTYKEFANLYPDLADTITVWAWS